ncbi:MAG: hypothetical protein IJ678_02335 [Kiritimatiellae bacterium]|nr:hypothetical protein [Kiritimatiellia bacterium]MBR1836828.1 hypothetical protein [Kiritimatiellia bacterium]
MTALERWEDALGRVLAAADVALEERHAGRWPLHPARPPHGTAANPQYDGIFRVTAVYTAGYGSALGPGYVLRAEVPTLSAVSAADREAIEAEAAELVRSGLAREFPGRDLRVERDGASWKIVGDLSLG